MTHFAGVVANVRNLSASLEFYEELTPLSRVATPVWAERLEPGRDTVCLADPEQPDALLRLVEQPEAAGARAYPTFFNLGIVKLGIRVTSITTVLENLAARAIPTTNPAPVRDYASVLDPDGIILSFMQHPNYPGSGWFHANVSVDRTTDELRFYRDGLGGEEWFNVSADAPKPAAQGPGSDTSQWDTHLLRWQEGGLNLDLARLVHPGPIGHPYPDPDGPGLMWLEFTVPDLVAARARLSAVAAEVGGAITSVDQQCIEAIDPEGVRMRIIQTRERS